MLKPILMATKCPSSRTPKHVRSARGARQRVLGSDRKPANGEPWRPVHRHPGHIRIRGSLCQRLQVKWGRTMRKAHKFPAKRNCKFLISCLILDACRLVFRSLLSYRACSPDLRHQLVGTTVHQSCKREAPGHQSCQDTVPERSRVDRARCIVCSTCSTSTSLKGNCVFTLQRVCACQPCRLLCK